MRDLKIPAQRHPEKAKRPDTVQPKKPSWIRVKAPTSEGYKVTRDIMREHKLVTVCEEAGCPNVGECWSQGHASMMIMGEVCTRACTFCNIATGKPPEDLDVFEPGRVADAVKKLGLKHVVITSVDRDDVEDGGAAHFAQTIRAIRKQSPDTTIEILTPDFIRCDPDVLRIVVEAKPDVFNHNLETVPGLYPEVRPGARYFHSLRLLQRVKELDPTMFTKSGIMVGLGEDKQSVTQVMEDMRAADIDFLTIGQYLQPTPKHHAVDRFVIMSPDGVIRTGETEDRVVFGPTCDSSDSLMNRLALPSDLQDEDYILFQSMGAYVIGVTTDFNGFGQLDHVMVASLT